MKWINEKTVQGDPMDIKNYYIPKEDYNIPLVNEGIQEGRKLVRCKDCNYWKETHDNDHQGNHSVVMECYYDQWHPQYREADDFCSRGEKK